MSEPNNQTPRPEPPKQIKLSKNTAVAIRASVSKLNVLFAAARAADAEANSAAEVHQQHVSALILDGGYKPDEFQRYGLWDDEEGNTYLRAS